MSSTGPSAIPAQLQSEPITYRKLDYWVRRYPHLFSWSARDPGIGNRRDLTSADIERLRVIARLTSVGLRLNVAAGIAANGAGLHQLSPHVFIAVKP